MKNPLFALAICSASVLWGVPSSGAPADDHPTTPESLAARGLADELLVAPSGDLIVWDVQTGRGFILGPRPGLSDARELRGPVSVRLAVSPGQRRAYLTGDVREVEIHEPDGSTGKLDLGQPIGGMVWLDDRRLAVSPENGDHRIEVLDTETGEILQEIEKTPRIPEQPGYRRLHTTDLAWDPERRHLHALDAFTGQYRVYDLSKTASPRALTEAQIDDRHRDRYEEQIAQFDRQLAEQGEFQGAAIWRFAVALDPGGTAWMVERCDVAESGASATSGTAHLLAVEPDGAQHRVGVETACCALRAVPWADRLAFAQPAVAGRPSCFATVPRPTLEGAGLSTAWLEVTPLSRPPGAPSRQDPKGPGVLQRLAADADPASILSRVVPGEAGLVLVCTGGDRRPVDCAQLWLDAETASLEDLVRAERPGRPVKGRVTLDGAGVAGAAVALVPAELRTTRFLTLPLALPDGAREPVREVLTAADGRFTLPALAAGDYRLLLELPGGRMDQSTTFTVTSPRRSGPDRTAPPLDLGALDFPAGVRLEVVIAGPEGRPIPGARAGAGQEPSHGAGGAPPPGGVILYDAAADPEGRAVIDGLAPERPVVVTCRAPGHEAWRGTFDSPPAFVPCNLSPLAGIRGRVVDEDGEPFPEARVTLTGGSPAFAGAVETATSDRDGRFHFDDLEPGRFRLVVASPGRTAETRSLTLDPGAAHDLGTLVLEPGERWLHRVVDAPDGEPVAGAVLTALTPPGSLLPATTDAWGEVELEGPATGPLTLEVRAEGFAPRRVDVPESARTLDAEPHEIVLERGGWIVARVWDEDRGAPCAGCRIGLSGSGPDQSLVTDGSGTARSGPLAAGPWQATLARLQGFGSVVTRSGGDDVRRVRVTPGTTSEVRFGDPDETLEIVLSPPPSELGAWRLAVRDAAGAVRVYALDDSGSATVRRPEGNAVLSLTGHQMTLAIGTLSEDAPDPTVIDRPSGSLTGHLPPSSDDGSPLWLELINLTTGRRTAEIVAPAGSPLRVPFLPTGIYELRTAGRSLATATVTDGQDTGLGELQ